MRAAYLLAASVFCCAPLVAISSEGPCENPEYRHGISHLLPPKYDADFTHFDYANPNAPKTGEMRLPSLGTFDNFNYILEKGRLADGYAGGLVYDPLLEYSIDETTAAYGRLAEGVAVHPELDWVAFKIRKNAVWHDGQPITVDDVLFTFETLKKHGSVAIRTALFDLDRIFAFGDRDVCFVRKKDVEINPILPFVFGGYGILPKHYWDRHDIDITKTTLEPPLVSGPYRLESYELGRILKYERVHDYWGRDLPVNKGRYNFDHLKWDYFTDDNVMGEAHKAHVFDVREEGVSKNWATQYNFPAVRRGLFKRDLRPTARVEGLWWPLIWNTDRTNLQDIRVREALWLLFDFDWTNRALFYNFYDKGVSFFQNSPMAHEGLPDERELALLEPWRDQIPPRVFSEAFRHPPSDGFGPQRQNIKRSLELFAEAGWEVRDGVMRNNVTGNPFTLDFIAVSYYGIRQNLSLVQNLDRVGIETRGKAPEVSQWLYRSRTGKFDGNSVRLGPSHTPGLQLRNWLGSAAADQDYGQNWSRIRNPAIDSLINSIISAKTAEDMYAAARALDRVFMWNFYFIPMGSQPGFRLVHWDKFGEIRNDRLNRIPFVDAWWWDEEKVQRVEAGLSELATGE